MPREVGVSVGMDDARLRTSRGVGLSVGMDDARLTPFARATVAAEMDTFVKMLQAKRAAHFYGTTGGAMLVSETSFFRDFTPFEVLRRSVIPRLIEMKREERRLTIWSAASSTGQEAYSLAMMMCESFPEVAEWDVKIVATDVSEMSREYAERGRYRRLEVNSGLPARMLLKYFVRDGEEWQIDERLRAMVEFRAGDLCGEMPEVAKFDLVLLRNVLLYFARQERGGVLRYVHSVMRAEGVLLLGNDEQAEDSTELFRSEFDGDCEYYRPR